MAQVQGEEIYLSHSGQEVDDNIDEVQAARGDSDDLSARLAAIVGDFEADQQRQETEIGVVAALGAKNLLEIIAASGTKNGLTFSINRDESVSINGTATKSTTFGLNDKMNLPNGQYILSGNVPNNVYLTARSTDGTNYIVTHSTPEIKINADVFYAYINIASGTALDNVVIKPMLRRAEITDSTYVPYAPTNRELYEMILALQSSQSVQSSAASLMQTGRIDAAEELAAAEPEAAETGEEADA